MLVRYRPRSSILALLFALTPCGARGDEGPAPVPPAMTLAQGLALAATPRSELYIAVDAEKVDLPADAAAPVEGDTAAQIATAFGRMVDDFGSVDAVAPPAVMVVNSPPDQPNIYAGMEPKTIVKLLAATFTAGQWKDFVGETGVSYASLDTQMQRDLFESLFPDHKLSVIRVDEQDSNKPPRELDGDQLAQARLRVVYRTDIALSMPGGTGGHVFANDYHAPSAPVTYAMLTTPTGNVDEEFGAIIRQSIPNTLKDSDLSGSESLWRTPVSVANAATVDDCVRAIAAATGREVYADPRYAARIVTMRGPGAPVPALDLMKALALCLGATWRQVGPAMVLTNDRVGLGVKHALWKEFEEKAAELLAASSIPSAIAQPKDSALTLRDVPFTADSLGFSDKQQEKFWKHPDTHEGSNLVNNAFLQLTIPFAQLTPAQQEAARHIQEQNAQGGTSSTLDGDVLLQAEPMVQIVVPALDGPVYMFQSFDHLLPVPNAPAAADIANPPTPPAETPPDVAPSKPPTPDALLAMMRGFEHRAVTLAPKSDAEITQDLAWMKAAGLNEMWLRIAPGATAADDDAALALLRSAAKDGAAAHIAVYAELSLLQWGDAAPKDLFDLDIRGRTPSGQSTNGDEPTHNPVTVFAPETASRIAALVEKATRVRGVAGMVWGDLAAPGYHKSEYAQDETNALGYALPGRLASLRAAHVDPIDLHSPHVTDKRANVSVPGFGDNPGREGSLYDAWSAQREAASTAFLGAATAALPAEYSPGPHKKQILTTPLESDRYRLFGAWDDLTGPPPGLRFVAFTGPDGKPLPSGAGAETMTSSLVYHAAWFSVTKNATRDECAQELSDCLHGLADEKAHSIVFFASQPGVLEKLASGLSAPSATAQRP